MAESVDKSVILLAVDASKNSEKAFDYYVEHIRKPDDKLVLLHAYEIVTPYAAGGYMYDPTIWNAEIDECKKRNDTLQSKYKMKCEAAGITDDYEMKVRPVPAGEAIVDAATQHHASLIVLGSRGLGKIRRTFVGSVSGYVVHHAKIPTLVVPLH